jgi:D-alanyl-lipoteichoic acid acyltransferase DltB (MBOAT superfamily)
MIFSSITFLFIFLPVLLAAYYACPAKHRNGVALAASGLFYAWGAPRFVIVLFVSSLLDYALSRSLPPGGAERRRKGVLAAAVALNIGLLLYFKYANFFVAELNGWLARFGAEGVSWTAVVLPIGISFFTFQKVSYLVDVYRGTAQVARNAADYLLYVVLFPQLIAGPIVRYHDVAMQLIEREHTRERFFTGILRFCQGLGKKVLVANTMAEVADAAFGAAPGVAVVRLGVAGGGGLCVPDLFRFQRLFGHGDRAGADDGDRVPGELQPAVHFAQHHGILAAVAHLAVELDAGIPVHSAGREPQGRGADLFQPVARVPDLRVLARGGLEFRGVGRVPRLLPVLDKLFKGTRVSRAPAWAGIPVTFVLVLFSWVLFRAERWRMRWPTWGAWWMWLRRGASGAPAAIEFGLRHQAMLAAALVLCFGPAVKAASVRFHAAGAGAGHGGPGGGAVRGGDGPAGLVGGGAGDEQLQSVHLFPVLTR